MAADIALYRRVLRQARPFWPHIAALLLLGLLKSPLALLNPIPLKIAVDSVLGPHPLPSPLDAWVPRGIVESAGALLAFAAALMLAVALAGHLQGLGSTALRIFTAEKLVLDFRGRLFRHLQRLSLSYHDSKGTGDSLYRIQHDAPSIQHVALDSVIPFVTAGVTLASMIYVTARIDWVLAAIALAITPPLFLLLRTYRPRLKRQSKEVKKLESSALSVVQEVLGTLRVVKAFGQEGREDERFVRKSSEGMWARFRLALAEGKFNVLVGILIAGGTAAVLVIGIRHVQSGTLALGALLQVMTYLSQLYDPLKTMSRKVASLQAHLASTERAFSLLDESPDVVERPNARPIRRALGAVAFRDVSFAYTEDQPVLQDISFDIAPGTQLGIAGTTGAGKSTLISLLSRFYDPTEGRILLDGVDLRDYRLDDLRRQFAIVLQEPVLFSASIAENIAYARPGASEREIIAAAQAANAHEFIVRLPHGYETQVGERGARLSGGQRQRVSLARAFLKDSPVLILDEPTSALDAHTEAPILEALERLKRRRTVILISHRRTTLAACSAVLAIEHGRIVSDTTRGVRAAPQMPARPARASAPALSTKRRETLLAHPAVQAWQRLDPDRVVPDRIGPAKFKANRARSDLTVYRLEGVGVEGGAVIAKRCKREDGLIERAVYEQVLPHVPLPGPRYYGTVPDPNDDPAKDVTWLFIGEIQGEKYDMARRDHRSAAARWLGTLHTEARAAAERAALPDAGPSRYRRVMRATGDLLRNSVENPALGRDDLVFLDVLRARFEELDEHWDLIETACTGLPPTLVHGDFNGKNLRVQASPAGPQIVAFDWEDAGRGVPCVDLAQVVGPSCRTAASPDLAVYRSTVRERRPEYDEADIERLATCGAVFRALVVIAWDAHHLAHEWADGFVPSLKMYEAELAHALERLGWGRRTSRPHEVIRT